MESDLETLVGFIPGVLTFLAGAASGAVASLGLQHYSSKPKITLTGAGSKPASMFVTNRPGSFGVRIGETKLFGLNILRRKEMVVPYNRIEARGCIADLIDKSTSSHVSRLFWDIDGKKLERVDLKSGDRAQILLFEENDEDSYYVWQPEEFDKNKYRNPGMKRAIFKDDQEFIVRIVYENGSDRFEFPCAMKRDFRGNLYFHYSHGRSFFSPGSVEGR